MTSFTLPENELNMRIAKALKEKNEQYVKTRIHEGKIEVAFAEGLIIHRSDIDISSGVDLTDKEWNTLAKEIKKTLKEAKTFHDKKTIEIMPLKTKMVCVRFNPIDIGLIKEAAKLQKRTISEFIRMAAIERMREVFAEEKFKKTVKEEKRSNTYVS